MDHLNHQPTTGPTHPNPQRAEADRLLGIAEKLLQTRDLTGSREFALLAQETEPLLEGSDQILAITDVLLASEKRVNNNRHHDWYSILQTDRRATLSEPDLLKRNYRRLALLLHPDKNRFPLSDSAFKLVADAWAVLSDPAKRTPYDHELSLFSKVDLRQHPQPEQQFYRHELQQQRQYDKDKDTDKLPIRRGTRGGGVVDGVSDNNNFTTPPPRPPNNASGNDRDSNARGGVGGRGRTSSSNFWTACPYCYVLYEYPKAYEECCLRCPNCERAFHAASIPSLPPVVPGKEAYYCCWGFFPLGFSLESDGTKGKKGGRDNNVGGGANNANNNVNANNVVGGGGNNGNVNSGFPNWMPGMFTAPVAAAAQAQQPQGGGVNVNMNMNVPAYGAVDSNTSNVSPGFAHIPSGIPTGQKKRGRPRKNPYPV